MRELLWAVGMVFCVVVVSVGVSMAIQPDSAQSKIVVADAIQTQAITIVNKAGKPMMDLGCTPDGAPFIVLHGPYKYPLGIVSSGNGAGIGTLEDDANPAVFLRFFAGHTVQDGGMVKITSANGDKSLMFVSDKRKESK